MNDANNHSYELPKPTKGVEIYSPADLESSSTVEKQATNQEQLSSKDNPPVANPTPSVQVVNPTPPITSQPSTTTTPSVSMVAEDLDVMEKEWVSRAKQVVEATRDNPRQQNIELAKVKADYLQKRFQKTLKVDEEKK